MDLLLRGTDILSVTELARLLRTTIEGAIDETWVQGEISNLACPRSGHLYFTLKDASAQIRAVIWRSLAQRLRFQPADGQEVLVRARLTVYEPRGDVQILVSAIEPRGIGALQLAFEQLKNRLAQEGLFDPSTKRSLPFLPRCVGVITSPTGAAIRDILQTLEQRFPPFHVLLHPARVQGEGAAAEIARAIRHMGSRGDVDVLIVARGGGSLEDLWAFNEEVVARAIADCPIPIVTGIGHEVDFTIADFVADVRAHTPTDAAGRVVPDLAALLEDLQAARGRLGSGLRRTVLSARRRLGLLAEREALRNPRARIRTLAQRLDDLEGRLHRSTRSRLDAHAERLRGAAGRLGGVSPLGVLARGYTVTSLADAPGTPLRSVAGLAEGDRILTRFLDGTVRARIEEPPIPERMDPNEEQPS